MGGVSATVTIAECLEPFMGCIDVCLKEKRRDSGVKQVLRMHLVETIR